MNSVLTRQSPNTPALDCVVQPDSLEQLHLSHLLVSRRAVRLATPGSLSGVLVYAEGGAISEDQNASKWGQFRRSNLRLRPGFLNVPQSTCACCPGGVSKRTVAFSLANARKGCMNSLRM